MDIVVGIVVGFTGLVGAVLILLTAAGGRAAREGRGDEHLLVAPRGARFGDATDLVLDAARAEAARAAGEHAQVVDLHEHRARRDAPAGHAA
ncbi:hypothetical protein [Kineococcus sp. SYSU DK002]|uniref:hypothetical protein n=1 Tax=Kineococcus sp. SYSU DK002 TaxID=3383123 RepID=UPI003D7E8C9A